MPTFNEQKGQGTFQPVLSDAGGVRPGGRTVPGSGAIAASGVIQGAASIFDTLASRPLPPDQDSEDLVANKADLEAELVGELSLIADAPIPGGVFRQAKDDVDRAASAFRQGRMGSNEINVRLASIVQRYIATDPRNAEKYRDLARNALGLVPSEQILANRLEDIEFQRDQQRQISRDEADFAISKGSVVSDGRGGIDVEATALRGRELRGQEAELDNIKKKLELQKLQLELRKGAKPTQTEIDDAEFRTAVSALSPVIDGRMQDIYQSMKLLSEGPAGSQMSQEEQIAAVGENINAWRAEITAVVNRAALDNGLTPRTRQDLLTAYLEPVEAAATMINGDLSHFQNTKRLLETMDATTGVGIRESAPTINRLRLMLGEQTTGSIVGSSILSDPELSSTVTQEAHKFALDQLTPYSQMASGERTVDDMSGKERRGAVRLGVKTIDEMSRRPQQLDGNQRLAYKNTYAQVIQTATTTDNVKDRAQGVSKLSQPSKLAALDTLRANDNDFEQVGLALRDANALAFTETARRLQPDTTIQQLGTGLIADKVFGVKGAGKQFVPLYNPETGRIEIFSGSSLKALGPAEERVTPSLRRDVELANENLEAIVHLKDYGGGQLSNFTESQIKQAIAVGTGIGVTDEEALEEIPGGLANFFSSN